MVAAIRPVASSTGWTNAVILHWLRSADEGVLRLTLSRWPAWRRALSWYAPTIRMRWTRRLPLQPGRRCAARRCRTSILRSSSPSSPICGRGRRRAIGPRSRWRRSSIWSGPRTGRRAGARWRRCPGGSTARRSRPSRPTRRPPPDFRGPSDGFVSSGREFPCRPHLGAPGPGLWRCWDRLEQRTERVRRKEQWKPTPRGAMLQESLRWPDAGTHAGKQDDAKLAEAI